MNRDVLRAISAIAAAGLLSATPARAEVLNVAGVYPAQSDGAAALQSISVERFGGGDGPALALRIEDVLRGAELQGEPWFRVLPGGGAEAVMRGTAQAEVRTGKYTGRRERCVRRDEKDKCAERKNVDVDCRRRTVRLVSSLRLIARDGALLYSDDRPQEAEVSWCDGDSRPRPVVQGRFRQVRPGAAPDQDRRRRGLPPVACDRRGQSRACRNRLQHRALRRGGGRPRRRRAALPRRAAAVAGAEYDRRAPADRGAAPGRRAASRAFAPLIRHVLHRQRVNPRFTTATCQPRRRALGRQANLSFSHSEGVFT